jgi:hypothetical protein
MHDASPLERQGAVVFQAKQCRNCHSIGGSAGERGPALDTVATRLTADQMRFKVVTGGGNMPAYGKNLSPQEIEALVGFLETLHPANELPAYDASRRAVEAAEPAGSVEPAKKRSRQIEARINDRHHDSRGFLRRLGHCLDCNRRPRALDVHLLARLAAHTSHTPSTIRLRPPDRISSGNRGIVRCRRLAARHLQRVTALHAVESIHEYKT